MEAVNLFNFIFYSFSIPQLLYQWESLKTLNNIQMLNFFLVSQSLLGDTVSISLSDGFYKLIVAQVDALNFV